jgi:hypothetical protein
MLNVDKLMFGNKVTKTVRAWRTGPDAVPTVELARMVRGTAAAQLVRAAAVLAEVDVDDEGSFARAADAFDQAEEDFMSIHAETEVTL